jgi:hypothetical protein
MAGKWFALLLPPYLRADSTYLTFTRQLTADKRMI